MNASFASGGLGMGVVFTLSDNFTSNSKKIQDEMKKLSEVNKTTSDNIRMQMNKESFERKQKFLELKQSQDQTNFTEDLRLKTSIANKKYQLDQERELQKQIMEDEKLKFQNSKTASDKIRLETNKEQFDKRQKFLEEKQLQDKSIIQEKLNTQKSIADKKIQVEQEKLLQNKSIAQEKLKSQESIADKKLQFAKENELFKKSNIEEKLNLQKSTAEKRQKVLEERELQRKNNIENRLKQKEQHEIERLELQKKNEITRQLYAENRKLFSDHQKDIQQTTGKMALGAFAMAAGVAMLAPLALAISSFAKMDDAISDVKKATGMAGAELENFKKQVFDLDTRTSLLGRMDIAKVGGQLGVANSQMADFVKMTDMAVVALGDEFSGGVEGVTKSLGVIKNLFKETKELNYGEAINRIGSAINSLGAAGSATGGNIADFANRIGGATGFSIEQTLALGSALEEFGVKSEIGASGTKTLLKAMTEHGSLFATLLKNEKGQQMNMAEYKNLYNTDLLGLVGKVSTLFTGKAAYESAQLAKSLKITDQEAQRVLMALANDTTGILKKSFGIAKGQFKDATSLLSEFKEKNENLPATIEKLKNSFAKVGLAIGNTLSPMVILLSKGLTNVVDLVSYVMSTQLGQWITNIALGLGLILFVTGGLIASTMALRLGVLKLVGSFALETQAIILNTIAKQGYLAGLKQMIVLTYEANKAQILMAAKFILFGAVLYGIYKAIDNYNLALAGLAIGIAFYFGPVYGIVAMVAAGFMILNKAMNEFSNKSVADLGKKGGFIGFLEKVGGLIEGVRTVFSSFNSELLTFQLSKSLEEKLAKIGMLDTVKNVATWLARFSVLWDGFKSGFSEMFVSLKNIIKDVIAFFTPITDSFFKWNTLIKQNTDFISSWKDAGYNAAYILAGALGFVALAFIGVKLQMLAAFAPMIIAFGAVVGLVYLVQQGFNYMTGSTYKFADALKVGIVIIGSIMLITKAYTTAIAIKTAVLTGYTTATKFAQGIQLAFNAALAANPIGITIIAVAALSAAMYGLYSIMKDVNREEQVRNDIAKEVQSRFADEQLNLDILFGKLKQAKIGSEEYNKVRDQLVEKYGEYDNNLKEELKTVEGMTLAYSKLTSEIRKKIDAEVKYEMAKKASSKNLELRQDIAGSEGMTGVGALDVYNKIRNVYRQKEIAQNEEIIRKLTQELINPNAEKERQPNVQSEGSVTPLASGNKSFTPFATFLSDAKQTQTSNNQPILVNSVTEKLQTVNLVVDGNIMSSFIANMVNNNIIRSTQ